MLRVTSTDDGFSVRNRHAVLCAAPVSVSCVVLALTNSRRAAGHAGRYSEGQYIVGRGRCGRCDSGPCRRTFVRGTVPRV